jgi:alanine dehydrogenase
MIVGVPKEIKPSEYRTALTPSGVLELQKNGHTILIEKNSGAGSGYSDQAYEQAGAEIVNSAQEIFDRAALILKVKEPQESEYALIKENQILFTYFHFASSRGLTEAMIRSKAVCIAYETVEKSDRSLPLLIPMSEVAGRMSVLQGSRYLEKHQKGSGVLLSGIPGVKPAEVLILGAGIVGINAAKIAAGLGARVTIMDINLVRLRALSDVLPANVQTLVSNEYNILEAIKVSDLIIGAVLVPGAKAPILIRKEMLALMKPGTVVVDVAVDQGGCIETCQPTTHDNPTYVIDEVVHYCVSNMPGAVPQTSTAGLTNATLPYVLQLANKGWEKASAENPELQKGLNIVQGKILYQPVADAFGL